MQVLYPGEHSFASPDSRNKGTYDTSPFPCPKTVCRKCTPVRSLENRRGAALSAACKFTNRRWRGVWSGISRKLAWALNQLTMGAPSRSRGIPVEFNSHVILNENVGDPMSFDQAAASRAGSNGSLPQLTTRFA